MLNFGGIIARVIYFRVEIYEGCALTLSPLFAARTEAQDYWKLFPRAETRVVAVNADGAALKNGKAPIRGQAFSISTACFARATT